MKLLRKLALGAGLALSLNLASACITPDTGNAPGYGGATNKTDQWQRLGNEWKVNDGVSWSVNGSDFNNSDMALGDSVTFQFDVQRTTLGLHDYDQIKAWIDWNGDKVWDNTEEIVFGTKWMKDNTGNSAMGVYQVNNVLKNGEIDTVNNGERNIFEVTLVVPDDAVIGETWMRARVSCWDTPYDKTNPYCSLYQGETEDYKLTIGDTPTPPTVPTPSAILLAGTGLAFIRRKFKK